MAAPADDVAVSDQVVELVEEASPEQEIEGESESQWESNEETKADTDVSSDQESELEQSSEPEADKTTDPEVLAQSVGGFTPDTKTCPEKSSFSFVRKVTNQLPYPIVLNAGEYTCSDWSGVSTPGRAFNNLRLAPGETVTVRLEPADNVKRSWTLAVRQEGSDQPIATPRLFIPVAAAMGMEESMLRVDGSKQVLAPAGHGMWTDYCDVLDLARTNDPDTPGSRWNWYFPYDMLAFVVRNGHVSAVSVCVG